MLCSIVLFSAVPAALACNCMAGHSACDEVAVGVAVFTGRVLSVSPAFLNRLNPASRGQSDGIVRFHEQLGSAALGQSLEALKKTFRELLPSLSDEQSRYLNEAKSRQELLRLFDLVLDQGSYVTLEVKTVFTAGHDDDDDSHTTKRAVQNKKANDDDDKPAVNRTKTRDVKTKDADDDDNDLTEGKVTSVWTPSLDCGVPFQVGETYLVYASKDENSDKAETDTCMGTRRLTDAGADLPYLSFLKSDPDASGHLEGFVTSDLIASANLPDDDRIEAPVPRALIELKSEGVVRYATSNDEGRFVFDGLASGSYQIGAYSAEYPDPNRISAPPRELIIMPKACARYVVLAQPAAPRQ